MPPSEAPSTVGDPPPPNKLATRSDEESPPPDSALVEVSLDSSLLPDVEAEGVTIFFRPVNTSSHKSVSSDASTELVDRELAELFPEDDPLELEDESLEDDPLELDVAAPELDVCMSSNECGQ